MRKTLTYPILGLILFLFCWINLPSSFSDRLRLFAAAPFRKQTPTAPSDELSRLQLENRSLKTQLDLAYEWLLFHRNVGLQAKDLRALLEKQLAFLPASVIYRDPSSWSSSLWVSAGEELNRAIGKKGIAKNSPVVADGALVGVVEYVGEKQSRIRLITDSGLSPSVRVHRGSQQNRELSRHLDSLLKLIEKREDLFASFSEKEKLLAQLDELMTACGDRWEDGYLAKGEVHGSSTPFWRSRSPMLRGIGFHFDDPDGSSADANVPTLKEGDLLVTSGLDGVFPPDLPVGVVFRIDPQQSGSFAYEMDVRPIASNLNDLQTVFILPPNE